MTSENYAKTRGEKREKRKKRAMLVHGAGMKKLALFISRKRSK